MNNTTTELQNLFRQFKLVQSFFSNHYVLPLEMLHGEVPPDRVREITKNQATEVLAKFIMERYSHAIKETEMSNGGFEYRTELFVIEMDTFKSIVEAAIQMIPQSSIDKIKNGETILK